MNYKYHDYYYYRFLEIIPGFLVWLTFTVAILLAFFNPLAGIYFIIVYDVYFVLRVLYMLIFLLISWFKYRKAIKTNWWQFLQTNHQNWADYYHLIFLPTAGEPWEVVDTTFDNLAQKTKYDQKKMILALAGEERFQEQFAEIAQKIKEKYQTVFYQILITIHPDDIAGEVKGKGSNLYHAGHEAKKFIDQEGIDYKKIIVSTFDIDTISHPDYFAYLTQRFISHKNPYRASFQPLAFYHNNVWESDIFTRVVANSTTFWLLTDLARPDRLFTFSSHSMSWQALVDIGFWQNNIVTEDSRIFLQCFIRYDGDYKVEPMHIPVSMNTVYVGNFWRSLKNQYRQMRRWAWGVEHFPYMVWHFKKNKKIPKRKKWIYIWNQTEGVYSWATAPVLVLVMGRLPLFVAEKQNLTNVLTQNAPLLLEQLMRFGMIGLFIIAIMSVVILPPMPKKLPQNFLSRLLNYSLMFLQWMIFPVTMILFGSVPAIDSQTRLMLGKYLGFWVTEKKKLSLEEN
ncbi:MAG: glycosyltransferase family 2 protein [Patescibacteria group bacterium]|nr:glycosyltransferase family 2 protein [Patescibacteria group bacterium]